MDLTSRHPGAASAAGVGWDLRRVTRLAAGVALAACAVALLAAGAFAPFVGGSYVDLGAHGSYASERYGLATEATDWRSTLFGWAGAVRLRVASESGEPIFVGVAPADAVDRYLDRVGHTTVGEHGRHGVVRSDHDGGAPATPPAQAADWTARAQGTGTLTLRWKATHVRQVALAMNADGSRPVRVRIVSSAVTLDRMPWWVSAGLVALGVLLLPAAVVLLRRTRTPRAARPHPPRG